VRVILIGRPADRDRLRPQLVAAGMEIVSEQREAPEGIARADVDAVVHVPAGTSRSNAIGTNFVPGATAGAATVGDADLDPLTARELEVLALVADGLSDAEVAERLVVSIRTVHAHLRSIYRKIDVRSRSAATRYALEHGLVGSPV